MRAFFSAALIIRSSFSFSFSSICIHVLFKSIVCLCVKLVAFLLVNHCCRYYLSIMYFNSQSAWKRLACFHISSGVLFSETGNNNHHCVGKEFDWNKKRLWEWSTLLTVESSQNHWSQRAADTVCKMTLTLGLPCELRAELPAFCFWSFCCLLVPRLLLAGWGFLSWQMWWCWSRDISCGFCKPAYFGLALSWKLLNGSSSLRTKNELNHPVAVKFHCFLVLIFLFQLLHDFPHWPASPLLGLAEEPPA